MTEEEIIEYFITLFDVVLRELDAEWEQDWEERFIFYQLALCLDSQPGPQ